MRRWAAAVLGALLLSTLAVGCGSGTPDYAGAEQEMNEDAHALTRALAGVAIVRDDFRIDTCTNDGSGSTPPSTRIELLLRASRTEGQLRSAAATKLRDLGYTVDGEANPEPGDGGSGVLIAGTRDLGDGRESKLAIELSDAQTYDFILASNLSPKITC
ncbi:MAG: hypothetical protein ACTHN0_18615 [Aquihabitans sp.]